MKRASFALIAIFFLLAACSPTAGTTPALEDAISLLSAEQEFGTSTPQPTSTISLPTPTPRATSSTQADDLPEGTPEEAATGEILGRITNGTSGAEVPDGLPVTLYGVDGQAVVLELAVEAGAGGEFIFEGVEMAAGRLFIAATEHQGVLYYTEPGSMPAGLERLELPLTIYDSTQDPALISAEQLHLLFDFNSPGIVSVLEVWVISNTGDKTFAPIEAGLEVILPDGAGALRFDDGGVGNRFQLTERGFSDLAPVKPGIGSSQLLFTFELPYERRLDFEQPISMQTHAVDVLLPSGGPDIRDGDLSDNGVRQVSTGSLQTYSTGPIAAGEVLEFRISGRISGAEGGADFNPLMGLVIGGALLGIVLVGLGLWWFRFGGRPAAKAPGDDGGDVLHAIAELDDKHAAGKISDDEYSKRREELKRRALELMQDEDD